MSSDPITPSFVVGFVRGMIEKNCELKKKMSENNFQSLLQSFSRGRSKILFLPNFYNVKNFIPINLCLYRRRGIGCSPRPTSSFPPWLSCGERAWWYLRESQSHRECNRAVPTRRISSIWPSRHCAWRVIDTNVGSSRWAWWFPFHSQRCSPWRSTEFSPTWGFRPLRCCSYAVEIETFN